MGAGSLGRNARGQPHNFPEQCCRCVAKALAIARAFEVIAACGKGSNWSLAVGLLQDARSNLPEHSTVEAGPVLATSGRQLRPDVPALNSALTALGRAGRWREARGEGSRFMFRFVCSRSRDTHATCPRLELVSRTARRTSRKRIRISMLQATVYLDLAKSWCCRVRVHAAMLRT